MLNFVYSFKTSFMLNRVFVAFLFVGLLLGCNQEPPVQVVYMEKTADVEKTVAKIAVEGMMCEIACGGKIRKELSEMEGVASADIDYQEGENLNYALVEYNPQMVNEVELMKCINDISDGKLYNVAEMQVVSYAPGESMSGSEESDGVDMDGNQFEVPGLTSILRAVINTVTN